MRKLTRSCTVEEFAVCIDKLFEFADVFEVKGYSEDKITKATAIYRKALMDLPPDLLLSGIERTIAMHEYGQRLPLPKEIRKQIDIELRDREIQLRNLQRAQKHGTTAPPERVPPTQEEREKVARILAETREKLRLHDQET